MNTAVKQIKRVVRMLILGMLLLFGILVGYYYSQHKEDQTQYQFSQILLLQNALSDLLSSVQDAQTGQRGYLLTGDESYLKPYNIALEKIPEILDSLNTFVDHGYISEMALEGMEDLINEKVQELATTVQMMRHGREKEAFELVRSDLGQELMAELRIEIEVLKRSSRQKSKQITALVQSIQQYVLILQVTATLALLLIFYTIYSIFQPLLNKIDRANTLLEENKLMLEDKNKELEHFAYIASHDLNEPLRTVSSFVDILVEDYGDSLDEEAHQHFNYIQSATERMKGMISGLLNYSRIGKSGLYTELDLNEIISEIITDITKMTTEKKGIIRFDKLPTIQGLHTEIRQLFQNLIINALKFSKATEHPVVEITAEEQAHTWLFCVRDNGIGIEKSMQHKIFNIFSKLHLPSQYAGQGIGLAFCKKIVELHQGKIWVSSTPGVGSSFYFTISKSLTNE